MISGINPNDFKEGFREGYNACFEDLSSKVKKIGKKYYKDFVDELKNSHSGCYTSSTHTHKCDCEYCSWDIKE